MSEFPITLLPKILRDIRVRSISMKAFRVIPIMNVEGSNQNDL